ncbi:MAG TPA: cytochrome c [Trueperaceae bacterium]|nr:cytochrome c [Trueperaceae bacterium]
MSRRRAGQRTASALVAATALVLAGCGSPYRGEPLGTAPALDTQAQVDGRALFDRYCSECHPGGAAGLAPGINNKPLPGWLVRAQVRLGMGAMPPFSRETISAVELDAIVAYVLELKK